MIQGEYEMLCRKILSLTMNQINIAGMKRYNIDKNTINSSDVIYRSAVADRSPITIAYTPAGTGKSALIKDRANAIMKLGVPPEKIMILNANIAKVKQMKQEMPGVNIKTFSEFTHDIFTANVPGFKISDTTSIANLLKLTEINDQKEKFITDLSMFNQQERAMMLTLFINKNAETALNILKEIKCIDYSLESMLCHYYMYLFKNNPYDIETILVNGTNNMPIPILCSVIEYANKYRCNLFVTGSDKSTIYDFNMAYGGSLTVMSAHNGVGIVRLVNSKITPSIQNVLDLRRTTEKLKNIYAFSMNIGYETTTYDIAKEALATPYLGDCLSKKEPVLILARSKKDITDIKQVLEERYRPGFPNMNVLDLTNIQAPYSNYGKVLVMYRKELQARHPNTVTTRQFCNDMYTLLQYMAENEKSNTRKAQYQKDLDDCVNFVQTNIDKLGSMEKKWKLDNIIRTIINIESDRIQKHNDDVNNNLSFDFDGADIILSTIHSAVDIRMDNVIAFIRNTKNYKDETPLFDVMLSRANKSEYLIFANLNNNKTSYQMYIEQNT